MDTTSMTGVLGLALDRALEEIRALGIDDVQVERIDQPDKGEGRGSWRVVRALSGGRRLTVARFPDDVEQKAPLEDCEHEVND